MMWRLKVVSKIRFSPTFFFRLSTFVHFNNNWPLRLVSVCRLVVLFLGRWTSVSFFLTSARIRMKYFFFSSTLFRLVCDYQIFAPTSIVHNYLPNTFHTLLLFQPLTSNLTPTLTITSCANIEQYTPSSTTFFFRFLLSSYLARTTEKSTATKRRSHAPPPIAYSDLCSWTGYSSSSTIKKDLEIHHVVLKK